MLKIVQDQERRLQCGEVPENQARQFVSGRLPNVQGFSDRGNYQLWLSQGRQVDKVSSSGKIPEDILHTL